MTAAVGHPTLRLVRVAIGPIVLGGLQPGEWRDLTSSEIEQIYSASFADKSGAFSEMLKKSASGFLTSLRGSMYRSERLSSSLAAALLRKRCVSARQGLAADL